MTSTLRLLVFAFALLAAFGAREQDVTIYRCIDAKGHLTLRDTPCAKGEKQEQRTMTRPQDAPRAKPAPVQNAAADTHPVVHAPARDIYVPPRPLYECVTPDNVTYTSDTGEGNPRYVPLWTMGYPS